jgi:hypothetical protein
MLARDASTCYRLDEEKGDDNQEFYMELVLAPTTEAVDNDFSVPASVIKLVNVLLGTAFGT